MSSRNGNRPIIIKRVAPPEEQGHHGGAWKVAYADFVTAMMAFFLLMWLLNATTEQQRQGLADYFNPTVVRSASGTGGAGATRGDQSGQPMPEAADPLADLAAHVEDHLHGIGAESMQMRNLLRHVVTRVTDEGLVLDLRDLPGQPLFEPETTEPTATMRLLAEVLTRVIGRTRSQLAVEGHVRSYPSVLARSPVWPLSSGRAQALRDLLAEGGLGERRFQRVTGHADRRSIGANPVHSANNRVEVILLRSSAPQGRR